MSFGGGAQMDDMTQMASMKMMLGIMSVCFKDCVTNYSSDSLSSAEKTCVQNCSKRTAQQFESMAQVQQQMQARMGGGSF